MLVWLDGRQNTKARPQENFGRELMELFTIGRRAVHRGRRLRGGPRVHRLEPPAGRRCRRPDAYYAFFYNAGPARHERQGVQLSDLSPTAAGRFRRASAADGMQDGIDLIAALARHPETARRLARKLWRFFVSEMRPPDDGFVEHGGARLPAERLQHGGGRARRAAVRGVQDPASSHFARYSWPVEFVVRAIKEVGMGGLLAEQRAGPARQHGAAALRAARRRRLDARARAGFRRRDAGAHELRRHADRQPAARHRPTPPAGTGRRRKRCCRSTSTG